MIQHQVGPHREGGSQIFSGELAVETLQGRWIMWRWLWTVILVRTDPTGIRKPRGTDSAPWDGGGKGPERKSVLQPPSGKTGALGQESQRGIQAEPQWYESATSVMIKGRVFAGSWVYGQTSENSSASAGKMEMLGPSQPS